MAIPSSCMERADLVEDLAHVSHATYERHYREAGRPEAEMVPAVNLHDRERAEDTVARLEQLGLDTASLRIPAG
jgi:hypothetical protein